MARIGIGIDCGAAALKVVAGREKAGAFQVLKAATFDSGEGDPLARLSELLGRWKLKGDAVLGVTGRDMIIRYTQVPPMPDWRLKQVMSFEIADLSVQSGGDLSADFNRLDIASSLSEDETILLTLIKNGLIDERCAALSGCKVRVGYFTPNAIALYNLLVKAGAGDSGTAMIVNIGARAMDIAIVRDQALIFARNLSGGSGIFDQALVESFSFSVAKAEKLKRSMGRILVRDDPAGLEPQEEKLARSLSQAAGKIYSMIQSSLLFCKAQIKVADIELDRLFLTGGGARLRGLKEYLSDNLGVEAELFDPSPHVDLSAFSSEEEFTGRGLEYSTAVGLAMMSVFDDSYAIQVLPEKVRERKRFFNETIYGILAAAVLLAYLAMDFYISMENYDVLKGSRSRIVSELRTRRARIDKFLVLEKENASLAGKLSFFEQKVIAGTGLARALRIIQENLPEELWIRTIKLDREQNDELDTGKEKKVIVRIEGSGRERGRPLQHAYTEFTQKLRADPLVRGIVSQASHDAALDFAFLIKINFSLPREGKKNGEEESGDTKV